VGLKKNGNAKNRPPQEKRGRKITKKRSTVGEKGWLVATKTGTESHYKTKKVPGANRSEKLLKKKAAV